MTADERFKAALRFELAAMYLRASSTYAREGDEENAERSLGEATAHAAAGRAALPGDVG